ncbi:hypothetical protein D3C75_466160 [compost metagenome]
MGGQGVEQVGHHFQVDHRGLVHHQHIQRQAIARVVPEMTSPGPAAEQAVNGGDVGRNLFPNVLRDLQGPDLLADGFCQTRRGLAGRCGETNAQGHAGLDRRRLEQRQQAHDGGGLAGSRPPRHDAEGAARRQGAGQLLPVDHVTRSGRTKQPGESLEQVDRCGFVFRQTLAQRKVDPPLVGPIAAQVQAFAR